MPKLRERCLPNFKVIRPNEVSLYLLALMRGCEVSPLVVVEA